MKNELYTIDAAGKILGRVASEAATVLRGKGSPSFVPYSTPTQKVVITNVSKIQVSGTKEKAKSYKRFSGYPGGLKHISYEKMFSQDPSLVLKHAIRGMLPKNKLRSRMINNLELHNGNAN